MNLAAILLVVVAADLVGDVILYFVGRFSHGSLPQRWRARLGLDEQRQAALEEHFRASGGRTLIIGKLTHSAGFLVLLAAGGARMPFGRFLLYNLAGTVPKSLVFLLIGYTVGAAILGDRLLHRPRVHPDARRAASRRAFLVSPPPVEARMMRSVAAPPPGVSCVVPAFNEAARIGRVLVAVASHPLIGEVIVVDDGSTDATADAVAAAVPGVRILALGRNGGKTQALRHGLLAAAGSRVLLLDADLVGLEPEHVTAPAAAGARGAGRRRHQPARERALAVALARARLHLRRACASDGAAPAASQRTGRAAEIRLRGLA